MRRIFISILILAAAMAVLSSCGGEQVHNVEERAFAMDTQVIVDVWYMDTARNRNEAHYRQLALDAIEIAHEMELIFSRHIEGTDVWRINNAPYGEYVQVHDYVIQVLEYAQYFRELTGGRFDVTIGAVLELWDFGFHSEGIIPHQLDINRTLATVGTDIIINGNMVRLAHPDAIIDLGAIAKGFASDRMADFLLENDAAGFANFAGDIAMSKPRPDGEPWRLGIIIPFQDVLSTAIFGHVEMFEGGFVTSGIDQRMFTVNGQLFHHILDVDTGFPVYTPMAT
ncbi:MAG: FAD:protein FMN transferase, partial [Defluviitaleaceae bacterium]|nr:FAD:protein FMN transferase [Defluviitaleaceae bacterium]